MATSTIAVDRLAEDRQTRGTATCVMGTMLSKLPYNKPADPRKLIAEFTGR